MRSCGTISDAVLYIEHLALDTVITKIKLGGLLSEAREQFPADQEFGQWRKESLPWMSRQVAFEHMQVFGKFGGVSPDLQQLPSYAVLVQLAKPTTPPSAVEKVLKYGVESLDAGRFTSGGDRLAHRTYGDRLLPSLMKAKVQQGHHTLESTNPSSHHSWHPVIAVVGPFSWCGGAFFGV